MSIPFFFIAFQVQEASEGEASHTQFGATHQQKDEVPKLNQRGHISAPFPLSYLDRSSRNSVISSFFTSSMLFFSLVAVLRFFSLSFSIFVRWHTTSFALLLFLRFKHGKSMTAPYPFVLTLFINKGWIRFMCSRRCNETTSFSDHLKSALRIWISFFSSGRLHFLALVTKHRAMFRKITCHNEFTVKTAIAKDPISVRKHKKKKGRLRFSSWNTWHVLWGVLLPENEESPYNKWKHIYYSHLPTMVLASLVAIRPFTRSWSTFQCVIMMVSLYF